MHIVHAVPFFDPATRFGGPVAQVPGVCRALAARGHGVSVVTTDLGIGRDLPRDRWLEKDGYRVFYARAGGLGRSAPYRVPRVAAPLREALVFADILHLHLSFTHLNVVARVAARRQGVPYVYAPRSCLDPVRLAHRRTAKRLFLALFERRIIRDAAAVHVLTDTERAQAAAQGARLDQLFVIPNAAPFDERTAFPDPALFREHAGLPAGVPVVLYLGRLHRLKGLDLLVEAFARTRRIHGDARLVVAGPDEGAGDALRKRAAALGVSEALHMTGPVDGRLRLAALRAADVFALTSLSEGMPNSVLEAAAAGTAVLITDACNLPEVAEYGAGRIVAPDLTAVADALADLLGRRADLPSMGRRGRRMVHERFSLGAVVERIERMYEQVVAAGRPLSRHEPPAHSAAA